MVWSLAYSHTLAYPLKISFLDCFPKAPSTDRFRLLQRQLLVVPGRPTCGGGMAGGSPGGMGWAELGIIWGVYEDEDEAKW